MFPNEAHQYRGILQLLLHFTWTWIGLLSMNDDNGEKFVKIVLSKFSQHGICVDFIGRFPTMNFYTDFTDMMEEGLKLYRITMTRTANVMVLYGEIQTMTFLTMLLQFSEMEIKEDQNMGYACSNRLHIHFHAQILGPAFPPWCFIHCSPLKRNPWIPGVSSDQTPALR